jgi:hypothetical protein
MPMPCASLFFFPHSNSDSNSARCRRPRSEEPGRPVGLGLFLCSARPALALPQAGHGGSRIAMEAQTAAILDLPIRSDRTRPPTSEQSRGGGNETEQSRAAVHGAGKGSVVERALTHCCVQADRQSSSCPLPLHPRSAATHRPLLQGSCPIGAAAASPIAPYAHPSCPRPRWQRGKWKAAAQPPTRDQRR